MTSTLSSCTCSFEGQRNKRIANNIVKCGMPTRKSHKRCCLCRFSWACSDYKSVARKPIRVSRILYLILLISEIYERTFRELVFIYGKRFSYHKSLFLGFFGLTQTPFFFEKANVVNKGFPDLTTQIYYHFISSSSWLRLILQSIWPIS